MSLASAWSVKVKYVSWSSTQLLRDRLVREVLSGKRDELVKHGQRVAQGTIRLLGDDVECFFLGVHPFLGSDVLKVRHGVGHRDAVEVKDLATRQNRRQDFVLLRGGQNEHRVRRWLLQGFQKRIERRLLSMCTSSMMYTLYFPCWGGMRT